MLGGAGPNLSVSTAVTVASGATLTVNGDNSVASLTSNGVISGSKTLTAPTYNLNDGTVVSAKLGNVTTTGGSVVNSNGAVTLSNSVAANTINVQTGVLTLAKADILSHSATLGIGALATLKLSVGDQIIDTLNGSGSLVLNRNNLNVKTGAFSGNTSSTGSLTKAGSGTLSLLGNNTFTQGIDVNFGTMIVGFGTTQTTNNTVVNGGGTLVDNGTITNNVLVNSGGTLMGSGTITGNLTGNGITSPGNSPGVLSIAGNYIESGTLKIEIGGLSGAGVNPSGHDQVSVGGTTILNSATSALQVVKYTAFEPSKGDFFNVIHGAPDSISGSFANFKNGFTNDVIFNRSTGQVIGTGLLAGSTGNDLVNAFPGATANVQSMLVQLKIGDHQFAGGDLISLLLGSSTSADASVIANRASPEAYAGFVDYAGRAAINYSQSAVNMKPLMRTDRFALFAGYSKQSGGTNSSADQANYSLKGGGSIMGGRLTLTPQFTAGVFASVDSGTVKSSFLNGSVKGNVYGLFGEYVTDKESSLTLTGSFSSAKYTTEGTRVTAGAGVATPGLSRFGGVGSSATTASLAVRYNAVESPSLVIQPELRLSHISASVNNFIESNLNKLQLLNIYGQSANSLTMEAAVSANYVVNPRLSFNSRLGISHNQSDASHKVTANVVAEAESFSVRSPGMGNTVFNLGLGMTYSMSDKFSVGASVQKALSSNTQQSNSFYLNAALSF